MQRTKDRQQLPNLRHVRLVTLLSEGVSLRNAAQRLRVTQPAATLGLRALEAQYQVPFFERRANSLGITDYGDAFARRASRSIFYLTKALTKLDPERSTESRLERLLNLLTVSQLRAITALDEFDGFHKAADSIGLSVPSVHRAIGDLEAVIGKKLVHRTPYGGAVNVLGHEIAVLFNLALRELRAASADVRALAGHVEGSIRLGCVRVSAAVILPGVIHDCVTAFPNVEFNVAQNEYEDMLERLRAGRMDYLCTTSRGDIPKEFLSEELFTSRVAILCGPQHPLVGQTNIPAKRLAEFPWISGEVGTGVRARMMALFENENVTPPPVALATREFSLTQSLLLQTDFLALLTLAELGPDPNLQGLCVLDKPVPDPFRGVWLISRRDFVPTLAQTRFKGILADNLKDFAMAAGL